VIVSYSVVDFVDNNLAVEKYMLMVNNCAKYIFVQGDFEPKGKYLQLLLQKQIIIKKLMISVLIFQEAFSTTFIENELKAIRSLSTKNSE